MTTWLIGDVHGCWRTLTLLLERIAWDRERDELWLVGDLVNRGPSSLEVLRWAFANRERLTVVLGNHDLHLLGRAAGIATRKKEDTLDAVLAAPDRDDLVAWLRTRPFVHHFGPWLLVHAGLMPDWSIELTCRLANAASERLAGDGWVDFLARISANRRGSWHSGLEGDDLLASAAAVFTRMRMVGPDGSARLAYTGAPREAPAGWQPWFERSAVKRQGYALLFGHWAMLGLHRDHDLACIDSGCVYGGSLTALRLHDGTVVQQAMAEGPADGPQTPREGR
ncbi:MAG: symmetrical bis(5'-nucleosyl)-tetraphosphatase [Thermoanaerobaculales bacterium]|jgi:bis(5'-nucleosyl)-tetraphosphatase (symmetrical)|nr:symmetrical bis(5'-nucleosyl)-tetraphosphatase [Thermoanaerobaculales bacterium]